MQKMADTLVELINPNARIVQDTARLRPAKSEVFRLYGDNTKLRQHTDWTPAHTLEQGLQATIDWFAQKEHLQHYKPGVYNV